VCAQNPFGIPVDVRNPLGAALGGFAAGDLKHGNLGMLMGLTGIASLLPLAVAEVGFVYGLWRLRGREE